MWLRKSENIKLYLNASMSAAREEKETSSKERDNFSLGATKIQ